MHKVGLPRPPAERAGAGTSDHPPPSPPPHQSEGWPAVTQPEDLNYLSLLVLNLSGFKI